MRIILTNNETSIPKIELSTARFWVKQELESKHLPLLPEHVERKLFFEGRTAWRYKYSDLHVHKRKTSKKIGFNVAVFLKKEFLGFAEKHHFKFCATCIYKSATHNLKVAEIKEIEHDQDS
jgi:hypothetical protein